MGTGKPFRGGPESKIVIVVIVILYPFSSSEVNSYYTKIRFGGLRSQLLLHKDSLDDHLKISFRDRNSRSVLRFRDFRLEIPRLYMRFRGRFGLVSASFPHRFGIVSG